MKEYTSYIFDLYGTLINIKTDENDPKFWKKMARIYASQGAYYKGKELHKAYISLVTGKEERLSSELGTKYPEIDLGEVFWELYANAPKTGSEMLTPAVGDRFKFLNPKTCTHAEKAVFVEMIANEFRVRSRKKLKLFKNTERTLLELRRRGKKVYLLSNAQALFTWPELSQTGLIPYFNDIFISSEHKMKKPARKFMEELLAKDAISRENAVMIGDNMDSDMAIAAKCGVDGILINSRKLSKKEIKAEHESLRAELGTDFEPAEIVDDISEIL